MSEMQDVGRELDEVIKGFSDLLRDIEKIRCDVLELKEYLIEKDGCIHLVAFK